MAAIPGLVWLFVGIFLIIASLWFGNRSENFMKFVFFIVVGSIMVLIGIFKMIAKSKGTEEKRADRYCPKCGSMLGSYDQFCPKCGGRV